MKILTTVLICVGLQLLSIDKPLAQNHFTLKPIADGVWAAIHKNPGGHAICNAGIIDLGDKTIIIDPFMNLDAAKELKDLTRKLTGRDADIVINTHHHNDHIRGNQLFPSAEIISSDWTKEEILKTEPKEIEWEKKNAGSILAGYKQKFLTAQDAEKKELNLWIDYFNGIVTNIEQIRTTLPNRIFSDSMWIYGPKNSIRLIEYKQAHTQSDVAVFVVNKGIVFTGDMLFQHAHPWLSEGDPAKLRGYLNQWAKNRKLKIFVPGHGDVSDVQTVKRMSTYIRDIQKLVSTQKRKGIEDSVILKTPIPSLYKDWNFSSRFYAANLEFICKKQ